MTNHAVSLIARAMLAASLAGGAVAHAQNVGIATSNPGSIYHSTGTAIAKTLSDVAKLNATVYPFASPTVYLPALHSGEYAFGISNVEETRVAVLGIEQFEGRRYADLRAVTILYPLRVAFFVRNDSAIKTVADLKGKRVVDGYGSQKTIPPLLDALYATAGMTRADIQPVNVPNVVGGADAFISGKADAFFFALGAAKVEEANASVGGIRVLDVANTAENLARVRKHFPPSYLRPETPGPRNVGVVGPVHALAYDAVLLASVKTPDETVYKVVKAMHDNKKLMASVFGPMNLFEPDRMATAIDPIQWHPGAVRFFTEQKVWPPK